MAKQKLDDLTRWHVWKEFSQKCNLCSEPIDLRTMDVDHLIPEAALKDARWPEVKGQMDIDDAFIHRPANWQCICKPCNGLKRDIFLPRPLLGVMVEKGKDREPRLKARIAKEKRRIKKVGYRALAAHAMRWGKFSSLKQVTIAQAVPQALRTLDISQYLGEDADRLRRRAVLDVSDPLVMIGPSGHVIEVCTAAGYKEARDKGYQVSGNDPSEQHTLVSILDAVDDLADYLVHFRFSPQSSLDDEQVSILDAAKLPVLIFEQVDQGSSVLDYLRTDRMAIKNMWYGGVEIEVEDGTRAEWEDGTQPGCVKVLTEIIRGDFDGDGDEEALVCVSDEGSWSQLNFHVLKLDPHYRIFNILELEHLQ